MMFSDVMCEYKYICVYCVCVYIQQHDLNLSGAELVGVSLLPPVPSLIAQV